MGQDLRPKITVLMPVFNCEKHIKTAISSILDQTYKNFEFLIINDGSTDLTEIIIKSFNDERINYIHNNENKGLVFTLNKGINLAKGELIARMDADDWAYPYRLERQVKFMVKNSKIGICGSNIELWDGFHVSGIWDYPMYDDEIKAKLFFKCSLAHPSVMFRKSLFNTHNLNYSEEFFPAEDYDLWTKMAQVTDFYNFGISLLRYRISENQISEIKKLEQNDKTFEISWSQLLRLNIKNSENYKSIHRNFLVGPWPQDLIHLKELANWLEQIHFANANLKIYHRSYFSVDLAIDFGIFVIFRWLK